MASRVYRSHAFSPDASVTMRPSTSGQEVFEVFDNSPSAAIEQKRNGNIASVCPVHVQDQVRQKRILGALDQSLLIRLGQRGRREIVRFGWYDVAHAAPRIGDIAGIAGNDVQMKVEDSLAAGSAQVETNIEAVWGVT